MPVFPKKQGFSMRSGNGPLAFKNIGSSPTKHATGAEHEHAVGGSGSYRKDPITGDLIQTGTGIEDIKLGSSILSV